MPIYQGVCALLLQIHLIIDEGHAVLAALAEEVAAQIVVVIRRLYDGIGEYRVLDLDISRDVRIGGIKRRKFELIVVRIVLRYLHLAKLTERIHLGERGDQLLVVRALQIVIQKIRHCADKDAYRDEEDQLARHLPLGVALAGEYPGKKALLLFLFRRCRSAVGIRVVPFHLRRLRLLRRLHRALILRILCFAVKLLP